MLSLITKPILNEDYYAEWQIHELQREFARQEYVMLPKIFTKEVFDKLRNEINTLKEMGTKKSYLAKGTNTPRILTAIGGRVVAERSHFITTLYLHHELWTLVSKIIAGPLYPTQHQDEFLGVHYMTDEGSTHGWHLDDTSFVLVVATDSPPQDHGGTVQLIPDWDFHAKRLGYNEGEPLESYVEQYSQNNPIQSFVLETGNAYLMRADRTLHRVTSLTKKDSSRAIVAFTFEQTPFPKYTSRVTGLYE